MRKSVEYFTNGSIIVACISAGFAGMFVMREGDKNQSWEFIRPGNTRWDAIHQNIYRNAHDYDPLPPGKIAKLPPIPPTPSIRPMQWHENFLPAEPIRESSFPQLSAFLKKTRRGCLKLYFTLEEDTYETLLGDGKFLYNHHHVFLNENDAISYAATNNALAEQQRKKRFLGMHVEVRSFTIRKREGNLVSDDFKPEMFEHYTLDEILADFEKLLV